jgi:general secretion pathway protein D
VNAFRTLCIGLLLACLSLPLPGDGYAQSKKTEAPATGKVTLDFKDIELADLIQTVSEMTGKNFIYDDTVKGKVSIISPTQMSMTEAYNLFLTVLNAKGFAVVPAGKVNKIVSTRDVKESNLPTTLEGSSGEQYVTHIVPLQNVDATLLATTVLAPLVPKTSSIVAYAPANTLIITDTAANIERLIKIIQELDVTSAFEAVEIIPLEYAAADEVAQICNQVIAQMTAAPSRGRAAQSGQAAGTAGSKVLPYPRTNALVVLATTDDRTTIKELVRQLDQKPSQERSHINVYYLENADAETLAQTLNEILTGIKAQAKQGRPAAAGQPAVPLANEPVTITADKPTNSLIINSNPEDYEVIQQIVRQLDVKRKQVFVEALILELSMDATQRLGASLQGAIEVGGDSLIFGTSNLNTGPAALADLASSSDSGIPTLLGKSIEGILLGGLFNPITVKGLDGQDITVPALSALIDVSRRDADVNILSAPRLLTSDNEEAEIIVGSNVPIITSRLTDTGGTGLAQSVSVERKDVALTLRFTPQITEGNLVRLNVMQEITDLSPVSVGDVNEVGPTLTKRLVRNTVLAENGRTIVLGGLIGDNVQETIAKTPLLGDIPGLGWLFKRKLTTSRKTNLLLFITPHIIRNGDDLATVTRRSRDAMDRFQDEGLTPGWQIDLPPAGPEQAPAEAPAAEPAGTGN